MQKIFVVFVFVMSAFFVKAQTFNGTGGSIPASSTTQTCWPITVTGVGNINDVSNGLSSVCIRITHPNLDELEVLLKAPDGTTVPLTIQNGGSGANYTNTCFSNSATTSIKFGTAPFSGTYIPEGYLGSVNNGQNANGTWDLCIQDRRNGSNQGVLNSWNLTFSNTPATLPPAFPACANTLPVNSSCTNATAVCDFNGLCGSTSGSSVQDWPGSGLGSCFGLQNNSFIKFIAGANTATFTVWVPTNSGGTGGGIQMLFFSGTCNSGAVTTHGCYPHIFPYQSPSDPLPTIISATGLTVGNTYYLMFDGFNNDNCTFRIAANTGITVVSVTPSAPAICEYKSVGLTASGGNGTYTWTPATGLSSTNGASVTASPLATTTYTVNTTTPTGCIATADVTVTVNQPPVVVTHPADTIVRVCQNGTVSPLSVSAIAGSGSITGYQWYITTNNNNTSGAAIPFATSSTYTPSTANVGTLYFYCRVTNSNGCIDTSNVSGAFIISPLVATPSAATTIQPTCAIPTGTIVVAAPVGVNIQYNIDGGAYQASGTFTGIAPGSHNITATNIVTGCVSNVRVVTVNAVPTEPLPAASVTTQPTCAVPTGTITITSPIGVNYEYSVGGTYQAGTVFNGLTNSTTYNVTVKNLTTGCISNALPLTVDAIPGTPAAPAVSITQPDCNTVTGSVSITSPLGINYEYSDGGTYQSTASFTGLTAGNSYSITVKDITSGCVSAPTAITINAIPTEPIPTATVTTQPTCTVTTGTITVSSPIGANYQYSVGGAYQANTVFTGLTGNTTFNVSVLNLTTGCISNTIPITVSAVPAAPAAPGVNVPVHPDCSNPTGSITINSPIGPNFEYSIGGTYQSNVSFTGLTPGTSYAVTVRDIVTGCISSATTININAVPTEPAPTAAVTIQPTCTLPSGTITISLPLGANYQYSVGGAYQASTLFTSLNPNTTYNVTVKNLTTGCISNPLPLVVNALPAAPAAPGINPPVQPDCNNPAGSFVINSPIGANYEYSSGGTYQSSVTFTGLAPGTAYSVTVRDISTGCVSPVTTININPLPTEPAPTASVTTQPNCTVVTGTLTVSLPLGANYQYSIGGAYQANPVFPGLAAGTGYGVTVKNISTGCISSATNVTLNAVPSEAAPVVAVTAQPDCITTTGTITVSSPVGANYQYSNGGAYQGNTAFTGLTPGTNYTVTVKNISNGCISIGVNVTVNAIPSEALPAGAVTTQPDCIVSTGTITVSSPTGANYQYSVGGAYQANTVFTGLTGNTNYPVTVKNLTTGCISNALTLTVNAIPAAPPAPAVTPPNQPDCNTPTATITVTSPVGINYQYSIGGTYQSNAGFSGLMPGSSYAVTVKDISTGCISAATNISVNTILPIAAPTVVSPVTYCQNVIAVPLTATGTNLQWYSTSSGNSLLPGAPTPSTSTPGNSFYYVTQTINGCESPRRAITVTVNVTSTAVTGFKYTPDTVCKNGINPVPAYDLGFTNGGTFTATPSGLNINAAVGNINLAGSAAGTYTVTYTYNTTGCVIGNSTSFNITLVPAVNTVTLFSYSSPVCKNAPKVLPQTAPGFTTGGTFSSSTGLAINSSTGEVDPGNSTPGQYQVSYRISALGCRQGTTNFSFITISDTTSPITKFSYSSSDVCISAGINPAIIKAVNFSPVGTFTVTPAGLNVDATTGMINVGLSVPGVYKIVYAVPAFGCQLAGSDSVQFILRAYGNPITTFSYFSPVCKGDDSAIAVKDIAFTTGGTFSATPAGLSINAATGVVDLRQSQAGNYTVQYDVPQGICNPAGFGTTIINVLDKPVSPSVTTAGICGPGNINLTATALGTISWYTEPALLNQVNVGATFGTFINNTTRFYVTNTVGTCESEPAIVTAVVSPIPAKPLLGGDTTVCSNEKVILNPGTYNGYLWQDGSNGSTYTVTHSGFYKVIVSTGVGCSDSATINITALDNCDDILFPNAFSPNGDIYNQKFGALGNLFVVSNYALRIFNRYGEVVFATADPYQKWDGTFKGKPVNIGAYVYVASYLYKNRVNKTRKGTLLLVR